MCCDDEAVKDGSDRVQGTAGGRPFDVSATAWLVGEAVRHLNTAGKEGELAYQRAIELLRRCGNDLLDTVIATFREAGTGDAALRWNLLYVLGDAGEHSASDFLVGTALQRLPDPDPDQGCEGSRDMEMLVCTMAIHALKEIAGRHPDSAQALLRIVSERPDPPILVEAVRAAGELRLQEDVQKILPREDQWILDIRRARTEELFADAEREDGRERGFSPPKEGALNTAPRIGDLIRTKR